jgi:hypothetical protein
MARWIQLVVVGEFLFGEEPFQVTYLEVSILGGLEELRLPRNGLNGSLGGTIDEQVGILPELGLKVVGLGLHFAQLFHWVVVQK